MFNKKDYECLSDSLQTSEEILYAIECVTGDELEMDKNGLLYDNEACYLWAELWTEGGRDDEILAALPTENATEGERVFWCGLFAEFDGEKWVKK